MNKKRNKRKHVRFNVKMYLTILGISLAVILSTFFVAMGCGIFTGNIGKTDDAEEMVHIIENEFKQLAEDYLLSADEAEAIVDKLKIILTGTVLKDMFASSDRKKFARNLLIDPIEEVVKKRKKITMPSEPQMQEALKVVLEDIADKMEEQDI